MQTVQTENRIHFSEQRQRSASQRPERPEYVDF